MDFRYLGNSGLKVSEISYGNWLTHGSQVENEQAKACVKAALEAGITTFDTADTYANTKAETVLGEALAGVRRESVEILTKVYWPTGPGGPNDTGLSRKHIHESINASLKRLQTDRHSPASTTSSVTPSSATAAWSGRCRPRTGPPDAPEGSHNRPTGDQGRTRNQPSRPGAMAPLILIREVK